MSGARIVTVTRVMHRRQKNMSGMGVNNRNVLSATFVEIICITVKACICRMRLQFSQVMLTGRSANIGLFEGRDRPAVRSITHDRKLPGNGFRALHLA
jgi:hypothetical protein